MAEVVHQEALVDQTQSVHVHCPRFRPGCMVKVIVLLEDTGTEVGDSAPSFFDGIKKIRIDAPADYSVNCGQGRQDRNDRPD